LSKAGRLRVRQLSSILRLAGGFDRSHTQSVRDVIVTQTAARELLLQAVADENPEVDLWGADRRSHYFADVFQTDVKSAWLPTVAPQTAKS